MKKIGVMQPYIFPYIGYFQLINAVDLFIFLDDVNFINKGWINRNNILINGKPHLFTIPLINASQNRLINEIHISNENWNEKLLKSIELSYKKAPHFEVIFPLMKQVFKFPYESIALLAIESIKKVCNYLEINTTIVDSSNKYNNTFLKGQDRIIDINKQENSNFYLNPQGGMDLYDKNIFAEKNLILKFLKPHPLKYKQAAAEFVPWLSIIDVLMWCTKEEIKSFLNKYELE